MLSRLHLKTGSSNSGGSTTTKPGSASSTSTTATVSTSHDPPSPSPTALQLNRSLSPPGSSAAAAAKLTKRNSLNVNRPRSQTYSLPPTAYAPLSQPQFIVHDNSGSSTSTQSQQLPRNASAARGPVDEERGRKLQYRSTSDGRLFMSSSPADSDDDESDSNIIDLSARPVAPPMRSAPLEGNDLLTPSLGGLPTLGQARIAGSANQLTGPGQPQSLNLAELSALAAINLGSSSGALPTSSSRNSLRSTHSRTPSLTGIAEDQAAILTTPTQLTKVADSAPSSHRSSLLPPIPSIQVQTLSGRGISKSRSLRSGLESSSGLPLGHSPPSALLRSSLIPLSHTTTRDSFDTDPGGGPEDDYTAAGPEALLGDRAFLSMSDMNDFDDVVNQLGTGYAVASSKRNADFHNLFKSIPDDDYLIEDYGCALQREILIQGRLYISEHHLSFNANIFGWVTTHVLPFADILSIEKRMTAYVIPNAIQVTTLHARHSFASFLSRDTTYDLIVNIWYMAHPATLSEQADEDVEGGSPDNESVIDLSTGIRNKENLLSATTGKRRSRGDTLESNASSSPSLQSLPTPSMVAPPTPLGVDALKRLGPGRRRTTTSRGDQQVHEPTTDTCPLLSNLKEVALDTVFSSAPEKIYNLMFTSGFMKEFWLTNQKLTELSISDWAPDSTGRLTRHLSYIKPLSGVIGPRQTKCVIVDENTHVDFEDFVCVITTTRTPDVPSGSAFSVKTRTSMTWAKGNSCRVVVTTGVEWTKSSFVRGIIERSCIEGQKLYHADLEKAMRAYIHQHRSEFLEQGQEISPVDEMAAHDEEDVIKGLRKDSRDSILSQAERSQLEQDRSGWIYALKSLHPIIAVGVESLASVSPMLEGSMPLAIASLVGILVLSNVWTLIRPANSSNISSTSRADLATNGIPVVSRTSDEVASAVRGVLKDYFDSMSAGATALPVASAAVLPLSPASTTEEVQQIGELLDALEERIAKLRTSLVEMD